MALGYKDTVVQWLTSDGAATEYTIGSLGFTPKAVMLVCMGAQSAPPTALHSNAVDWRVGIGFAEVGGTRRSVASYSQDNVADSNCGVMARNDAVLTTVDGSGAITGALDVAFDSDGIRLIVDDVAPVNLSVLVKIWGGTDISAVAIGDIAEPAATGNQDYSATGMVAGSNADQILFLAGVQSTAALNSGQAADSGICFGMAHNLGQFVISANSDDASATSDTDQYSISGECLAQIVLAGGQPNARASFTQWNTDGFRLNWAERATTNRRNIFMAIKGGQWAVGETTIDSTAASNTATVSGLAFQPEGLLLGETQGAESTSDTSNTLAMMSIGGGTSSSDQRCVCARDDNGATTMATYAGVRYDCALSAQNNSNASRNEIGIDAMLSDGFRMIMNKANAADSTSWWMGYCAFASEPSAQEAPVGQASETDTGLSLAKKKTKALGLATETDTALALAKKKVRATGLATETDSAQSLAKKKTKATGLATGVNTALALGRVKTKTHGLSTETDAALALSKAKARATGMATETDTAIARQVSPKVGACLETDTAFALGKKKTKGISPATETDTALALGHLQPVATGRADETDAALALSKRKEKATGQATSTNTAIALTRTKIKAVGMAVETSTALALGRAKVKGTGLATSTNTALALAKAKTRVCGTALEANTSISPGRVKRKSLARSDEVDTALALVRALPPSVGAERNNWYQFMGKFMS